MMKKSFSTKKEKNKNKKKNRVHLLTQKDMNVMFLKKFCASSRITYMAIGFRPRSFPVGGMYVKGIGRLTKV